MNKKKIILVAMLVALIVISSVSFAAVYFNFTAGPKDGDWKLTARVGAEPPKWRIFISSIDRPAVGRVWYPDWSWGSALFTYPANASGTWRRPQKYRTVVSNGDQIMWGMRLNNDYTGVVNVSGWFYP